MDRLLVNNISKSFMLPHDRHDSLKKKFLNLIAGKKNKSYNPQNVLQNISFKVKHGEFFGILGKNGSGKSTLLKIISGVYSPNSGEIKINGKLVPFIELGVGFNPELTGRENVYLSGAIMGFSNKEMDKMYDEIVEFAELEEFMDQKLKNYSSGMQVRLAFSLSIRAKSDVLLIDEVLAVGDAAFQKKCFDYFKKLKKEKHTVILVTHDMNAVTNYCDRAIVIDKGQIVYNGKPNGATKSYLSLFS